MKEEFTMVIQADNNFSVLNRIINILNRRRVRIIKLLAQEDAADYQKGAAILLLFSTRPMMEKVKHQMEKLIEVESARYSEGSAAYFRYMNINTKETV